MSRVVAPPFLQAVPDRIADHEWEVTLAGALVDGTGPVEGWDYNAALTVRTAMTVDIESIREDCGLRPDARLGVILRWHASTTNCRDSTGLIEIGGEHVSVVAELPGSSLGGRLVLEVDIVTVGSAAGTSPLAPTRPGSIVWRATRTVRLEGDTDRFPVELRSFEASGVRGPNAAWMLQWESHELEWSAGSAVRLWLNSDHPAVKDYLADPDSELSRRFQSVLIWDISRLLLDRALDDDEFNSLAWPDGTIGGALAARLRTLFPGLEPAEVRALRRDQPADYQTAIQAGTALLRVR